MCCDLFLHPKFIFFFVPNFVFFFFFSFSFLVDSPKRISFRSLKTWTCPLITHHYQSLCSPTCYCIVSIWGVWFAGGGTSECFFKVMFAPLFAVFFILLDMWLFILYKKTFSDQSTHVH